MWSIRPLLTQKAAQVLVQALVISRLNYWNSFLSGLPTSAIRPLQLIQNATTQLVFNLPKFTPVLHSSAPFTGYQWLPASITKHLRIVLRPDRVQSTSRTWSNLTPQPVHSISASANWLVASSLRANHSTKSPLFAVLAPKWWTELPNDIRTTESLYIFSRRLKTHLFQLHLG